jgi:uncharacterized membrane protein YdjX (TVP38/TMEM64 family)
MLAGWMIDGLLGPFLGDGGTLLASLVGSSVVFYVARRWLIALRDG